MEINDFDKNILRHMLGANSDTRKSNWGYRNYFCACLSGTDYDSLAKMEKLEIVKRGQTINGGKNVYFFATLAGCKAIGLHKAAIKRAFEK